MVTAFTVGHSVTGGRRRLDERARLRIERPDRGPDDATVPGSSGKTGGVSNAVDEWSTLFTAMVLQALPFLVLGVLLSAAVAVLVPLQVWRWILARRTVVAVPAAAMCGAVVPGCECTTVPIAGRLTERGVPFAAAMSFALASPALNPIVLLATAAAFAGQPSMVVARFVASFLTVLIVGAYLAALGVQPVPRRSTHDHVAGGSTPARVVAAARHDFTHTAGLVVLGAAVAATIRVALPDDLLERLGGNDVVAVLTMAVLAVVMALCSESDAFVAVSFVTFPPIAVLAFMVVGPIVDLRLLLMYRSTFGSRAAATIGALGFVGAIIAATVVGRVLL